MTFEERTAFLEQVKHDLVLHLECIQNIKTILNIFDQTVSNLARRVQEEVLNPETTDTLKSVKIKDVSDPS